jgi:hypothetical protein
VADHPVTVVYDYDDTLVGYKRFGEPGVWLEGAADALRSHLAAGRAVVVASCRVLWDGGVDEIEAALRREGFEPKLQDGRGVENGEPQAGEIAVWLGTGKPLGYAYVDDKGVEFGGDHEAVLERLKEVLPR